MQSWVGRKLIEYVMKQINAGNIKPALALDAPDVELTFPGRNSWSGVVRGKTHVRAWQERFVRVGLQIFPDEVIVKGFPWNATVCVRGTDHLDGPDGTRVYENRYVIWGHMRWGRMKRYEVYEDTIAAGELDDWLAANEPALSAA